MEATLSDERKENRIEKDWKLKDTKKGKERERVGKSLSFLQT